MSQLEQQIGRAEDTGRWPVTQLVRGTAGIGSQGPEPGQVTTCPGGRPLACSPPLPGRRNETAREARGPKERRGAQGREGQRHGKTEEQRQGLETKTRPCTRGQGEGETTRRAGEQRKPERDVRARGSIAILPRPSSERSRAPCLRGFGQTAGRKLGGPGEVGRGEKGGRERSCRAYSFFWGEFRR